MKEASVGAGDNRTMFIASDDSGRVFVRKAKLLVVGGPMLGQEFAVDNDSFSIGGAAGNDLELDDSTVSRHHCEILRMPVGYAIKDLGSRNGTMVQGVKVVEAFLGQGNEIQLGQTRLIFCPLQETSEYELSPSNSFGELLGKSAGMRRVFHLAEKYSPTDAAVLIEGETGTGKEVLAREIHLHSRRRDKPFVVIDCAGLSKELAASEMFGHVKGAFTGADGHRIGAFEQADGGTVFLDEIGTLGADLQPKLLRVLESKEVRRVGSNDMKKVDVRIIAATNARLESAMKTGQFREDLFFRLSVVRLEIPPLRKRKEDLPMLAGKFLREFCGDKAMADVEDFDRTMASFSNHDWPGNVRELRNVVQLASYSGRKPLTLESFLYPGKARGALNGPEPQFRTDLPFKVAKSRLIAEFETAYIRDALARNDGNISRAAKEADIERPYLQRLVKEYGLNPKAAQSDTER